MYKFGGSSVRDGERMKEVADIICSFPDNLPIVVLSAMGKVGRLRTRSSVRWHSACAATCAHKHSC